MEQESAEVLLKPAQVAALFDVDPKTVSSWGDAGKLTVIRTLGGHRRFRQAEVLALRNGIALAERESRDQERGRAAADG
jgi:predicted site-specific integrase-resolvase